VSRVELRRVARGARRIARGARRRVGLEAGWLGSRHGRADLALFHEFAPPPAGGGHQFLRALTRELAGRGLELELNRISGATPACLFNSFNFDFDRLRRYARDGCRMVHRVDGPIGVYRGFDDGTDRKIAALNAELADATVFQSRYSLEKHRELGLELVEPVVVPNSVDPAVFHPPAAREPLEGRKVGLIATSWSDNPRKGADTFGWLDRNLDWSRFELTFVGPTTARFERIRVVPPVPSTEVAELLRGHDVYLAASHDDPASNALLEGLACGLPAVFRASGGHPELVGEAGLPFDADEELPEVLDRLVAGLEGYRGAIVVPPIEAVADRYLEVLGLRVGA
jgi:glycosyltransferase involved in cell wall biosynthesis